MNARHQQFISEYLKCWVGSEAYKRVYPEVTDETARVNASRLLTNANISEAINQRIAENAMGADEVLDRLAEQARAAYSEYMTAKGVDLERMISDGKGHLIKKLKPSQYGLEIEFYDAQTALVHIGKHHKLFVDKTENKTDTTIRVEYGDDGSNSETTETA